MGVYRIGKNFYIRYTIHGRQIREVIGPDKKVADRVFHERALEALKYRYPETRKSGEIKFEDFTEDYLERHCKSKHKSLKNDIYHIIELKKHFAGKSLREITPKMIENWRSLRLETVKPATVNRGLAFLKSMYNRAIEWEEINTSPMKKVKLDKEPKGRCNFLEKEEIPKLLDNCAEHLRAIVLVAINTGMRRTEILNLKWRDVDFRRDLINLFDTKNGETREVPMNEVVKKILIGIPKHPESPYIFCHHGDKFDGKPYKDVKKSFFTALKKAGIIREVKFRFHDLRHTAASHLVMNGVDLKTVQEILGHKSFEMTLRYAHLSPGHKKKAVDRLGELMTQKKQKISKTEPVEQISLSDKSAHNILITKE